MRGYAFGLIGATLAALAAVTLAAVGSVQRLSDPTDAVRAAAHLQAAHDSIRKAYVAEADSRALLEDASRQLDAAGGLLAGSEVVQAAVSRAVVVSVVAAGMLAIVAGAVLWSGSFRWVITPLSNLAGRMQRLTEDPAPIDLPARGPREIRALQHTFNRLVAALHGYRERITQLERANIGRFLVHQFRNSLTPIRLGADELAQAPAAGVTRSIAAMLHQEAARMEAVLERFHDAVPVSAAGARRARPRAPGAAAGGRLSGGPGAGARRPGAGAGRPYAAGAGAGQPDSECDRRHARQRARPRQRRRERPAGGGHGA